jgi:hypothetical protein
VDWINLAQDRRVAGTGSTKLLIIIKPRQMLAEELSGEVGYTNSRELSGEVGYTNSSLLLPISRSVTTSSDRPQKTATSVTVCAEDREIDC